MMQELEALREALVQRTMRAGKAGEWSSVGAYAKAGELVEEIAELVADTADELEQNPTEPQTVASASVKAQPSKVQRHKFPYYTKDESEEYVLKLGTGKNGIYKHRASTTVLDEICTIVSDISGTKTQFSTDEIEERSSTSSYQIYVILGAMRSVGAIEDKKRGSYVIKEQQLLDKRGIMRELPSIPEDLKEYV
jgi:plasmid replication initiation protein